ncbi:unnamed protein product, partial [Didymodactylos carnosus]
VPDDDPKSITVMFKDAHNHDDRNQTSRVPSPVRQSVSKYVGIGLTEAQIRFTQFTKCRVPATLTAEQ